jgi:hypothetical protein
MSIRLVRLRFDGHLRHQQQIDETVPATRLVNNRDTTSPVRRDAQIVAVGDSKIPTVR